MSEIHPAMRKWLMEYMTWLMGFMKLLVTVHYLFQHVDVHPSSRRKAGCQNKHDNSIECDRWASEGKCEANPLWMIPNCQMSCRACDKPIPTQAPATTPFPDIDNGIQIMLIAVVAGLIVAIVILVTVIIALKRRFPRNEYEVPVNSNAHGRQSHVYMNLNLPSPT